MIAVRLLAEGAVVREAVFSADAPLALGRGPECDFVIVDPSVSRQHARVRRDETGAVWIEDAASRNGLVVGGVKLERAEVPAEGVLRCRLGAAELELAVASAEATLELARPQPPAHPARRALQAVAFWAAGIAALVAAAVIQPSFWSPWDKERATSVSWLVLTAAVTLPILAFVLVGLLRIAGRRLRLRDTLRALAVVCGGWALVEAFTQAAAYALSVPAHGVLDGVLSGTAAAVSLAYLASVGRAGRRRRFFLAWVAATGALVIAMSAVERLAARQAGTPALDYDVAVPVYGLTGPAADLEGYLALVRGDFEAGARQAEEERRQLQAAPH